MSEALQRDAQGLICGIPLKPHPRTAPRQVLSETDREPQSTFHVCQDQEVWERQENGETLWLVDQKGCFRVAHDKLIYYLSLGYRLRACHTVGIGGPKKALYDVYWAPSWVPSRYVTII